MTWRSVLLLVVLVTVAVLAVAAVLHLTAYGVSARDEPTAVEAWAARAMRRLATPSQSRGMKNPISANESALADGRSHFADHCALCHDNDGKGRTAIGRNLYPKAPDMTLPQTQQLTDGELFYVITNGVRLTGMPAWGAGSPEDDDSTWKLVLFIRQLNALTPEQLDEMRGMNPRTRAQFEREEAERRWLEGGNNPAAPGEKPGR